MNEYCMWRYLEDWTGSYWETSCNNKFQFINGSIEGNDFKYCPYCGKEIAVEFPIKLGIEENE